MTTASKNASTKKTTTPEEKSVEDLIDAFLEDVPLLPDEDDAVFRHSVDAVIKDTGAISFLGRLTAKDFVEKLYEEQRLKGIGLEIMKGARRRASTYSDKNELELDASDNYLPKVVQINRMITNSQAGRRANLKELQQYRSKDAPPLVPEQD